MKTKHTIREASSNDSDIVGTLVNALLCELMPQSHYEDQLVDHIEAANSLMSSGYLNALLAYNKHGKAIGVCTMHQCAAVYAKGLFGEISELYIDPDYRSGGLGADFIKAARVFGHSKGWRILEVGAPDVPRWQRTVNFYLSQGFSEVGPRLEIST